MEMNELFHEIRKYAFLARYHLAANQHESAQSVLDDLVEFLDQPNRYHFFFERKGNMKYLCSRPRIDKEDIEVFPQLFPDVDFVEYYRFQVMTPDTEGDLVNVATVEYSFSSHYERFIGVKIHMFYDGLKEARQSNRKGDGVKDRYLDRPGKPEEWIKNSRGTWDEHRRFPMTQWAREVGHFETRLGYIKWVAYKLKEEKIGRQARTIWTRATFAIYETINARGYYLWEEDWNGWLMPAFEKDELIRWLKDMLPDDPKIEYIEKFDAIYCPPDGDELIHQLVVSFDVITEDGPKHLYGPSGWKFCKVPDSNDLCWCGHTREAHTDGGDVRCGVCNCQQFSDGDIPF